MTDEVRAARMAQAFLDHEFEHHGALGDPVPRECLDDVARRYDAARAGDELRETLDEVMRHVVIGVWYDQHPLAAGGPAVSRLHSAEDAMWRLYDRLGIDPGDAYTRRATDTVMASDD